MSNPEKIALLTDSTADLTPAMREGKPIYVVPLKIRCDDGEFSDGVDIFAQDVYDRLHRGELPRTSLPEGGVLSDTLDQIRADGYEKVIAVMLSGGLSGTCNLVRVQAEQRDDLDIAVFDSRSGSLGIGIIVLQLWEEIQAGTGWDKLIHERVPHLVDNTFPFFSVDTLEYLRRGGRIGRITALAGTMLSIKPVMHVDDEGRLVKVGTARGRNASLKALVNHMEETAIDPGSQVVFISHGDCLEDARYVERQVREKLGVQQVEVGYIGPVIGAHSGPGTVALFFLGKER